MARVCGQGAVTVLSSEMKASVWQPVSPVRAVYFLHRCTAFALTLTHTRTHSHTHTHTHIHTHTRTHSSSHTRTSSCPAFPGLASRPPLLPPSLSSSLPGRQSRDRPGPRLRLRCRPRPRHRLAGVPLAFGLFSPAASLEAMFFSPRRPLRLGSLLAVALLLLLPPLTAAAAGGSGGSGAAEESCFCDLQGAIDDCCCSAEDVNRLNAHVLPLISRLGRSTFFRFYKARAHRRREWEGEREREGGRGGGERESLSFFFLFPSFLFHRLCIASNLPLPSSLFSVPILLRTMPC